MDRRTSTDRPADFDIEARGRESRTEAIGDHREALRRVYPPCEVRGEEGEVGNQAVTAGEYCRAALGYVGRGWAVIPVPLREKGPRVQGWPDLHLSRDDVHAEFGTHSQNVGVLLGAPSGGLVDIDLDSPEALALAPAFLPPTGAVFGRTGKPRSHHLYRIDQPMETARFRDPIGATDRSVLVEVRATRQQTIFPPSIHPSGERINWDEAGEPALVSADELSKSVGRLAGAALLARHWPPEGSRHDAALALAGGLVRAGWTEQDLVGFVRAVVEVAGDEEADDREAAAQSTLAAHPAGETTTGWPRLASLVGSGVVDAVRGWLDARAESTERTTGRDSGDSGDSGGDSERWEPPVPLRTGDRPEFPTDALPGNLRAYVDAVAVSTQTPAALPALVALAVVAAGAAKRVAVRVRPDWIEPVNVFAVVALPPGTRKSAVFRQMVRPLEAFEAGEARRLRDEIAEARSRKDAAARAHARAQREEDRAEGEDRNRMREEVTRLARELAAVEVPVAPRLVVDDCTPERLVSLLEQNGGRIAALSAEGGVFDLMAGRYAPDAGPNLDVYLKGHAGDALRVDRVGREPEFVPDPALTIGVTVQPDVVLGLARRPGFRGRGLLARFWFALPHNPVGRRAIDPPPVPESIEQAYDGLVSSVLALPPMIVDDGNPLPNPLDLDEEAALLLRQFRTDLEPRLAELGDLGHMADWAAKLPGAVARLAGLLHVAADARERAPREQRISGATMAAAVRIGHEFLLPHAVAAFADMGADPAVEGARHLWARITGRPEEAVSKRDLFQAVRGRFHRVEQLEAPLGLLVAHGYLRPLAEPERAGPGRRASPVYLINPLGRPQNPHNPQNGYTVSDCADSGDCGDATWPSRASARPETAA